MNTATGGTYTSKGLIPHKWNIKHGFFMPVRIIPPNDKATFGQLCQPMKRPDGSFVYVVPGGQDYDGEA